MKDTVKISTKFIWLSTIVFWVIYTAIFYLLKEQSVSEFQQIVENLPIYQYVGNAANQTLNILSKYGGFLWIVLVFIILVFTPIILLMRKILFLWKYKWSIGIFSLLLYIPFFMLGYWLAYLEPHILPMSIGVILFIGKPLLYSTVIMFGVSVTHIFYSLIPKKNEVK